MAGYNTNLAAEFYVLSMLHRLGADANLTLGNKKSVDIAVIRSEGEAITIDVKGLEGITGWPIDNVGPGKEGHFLAFVCFQGKIKNPDVAPLVWIVPSKDVHKLAYNAPGGRRLMRVSALKAEGIRFKDAWHIII